MVRWLSFAATAVVALGCHHERALAPAEASYTLAVAGGDLQHAPAGSVLPLPIAVVVRDVAGTPVKGSKVTFRVQRGAETGSRVLDSLGVTSPAGIATTQLQLGSALDTTTVSVYPALASQRSVTLRAVATVAPALVSLTPASFGAGDTLTLRGTGLGFVGAGGAVAFGSVLATPLAGAASDVVRVLAPPCLSPGAMDVRLEAGSVHSNSVHGVYSSRTAPLVLAPFQWLTVNSAQLAGCLTLPGGGASYLLVAEYASVGAPTDQIDWRLGSSGTSASIAGEQAALRVRLDNPVQRQFEATLRAHERAIAPLVRAEVGLRRQSEAQFQIVLTAPPAVGSLRTFKTIGTLDGTTFSDATGRLKYAGDHLLLYVDTIGSGFTDDQYRALAAQFDHDLYPVAVGAFGSESDVDHDGRILVFFTPAVNRLIPAANCIGQGYVTGFFYGNDLLVQSANSNKAEIFFSFIPDTTGAFGCTHAPADVMRILPGTFIHEMQHMISFNQHVLARGGDVEETWLNEGLSQISEELGSKYYEAKFPAPTGRSTTAQIFPDSAGPFIAPQLLNAYVYLGNTRAHSVTTYNGAGSIEERGATWLFLRWLGEQKGDDLYGRLVQTSKTGIANLEDKSGEPFGTLFGDFALALYTDSLAGLPRSSVPARLRFGTRDLRQLMAREAVVSGFSNPFPLPLFPLVYGGFLRSTMLAGTMTHVMVQTAPTAPGFSLAFVHQDLTAFAPAVGAQVSILRLPP